MIVYRISRKQYRNDLSGTGAKMVGGRWNSPGLAILYTTRNISLSLLELMVHTDSDQFSGEFSLISIEIPDKYFGATIDYRKLKRGWYDDEAGTQFIGDSFGRNGIDLCMQVPSVLVPEESNILINPVHAAMQYVTIVSQRDFSPDKRLFPLNV